MSDTGLRGLDPPGSQPPHAAAWVGVPPHHGHALPARTSPLPAPASPQGPGPLQSGSQKPHHGPNLRSQAASQPLPPGRSQPQGWLRSRGREVDVPWQEARQSTRDSRGSGSCETWRPRRRPHEAGAEPSRLRGPNPPSPHSRRLGGRRGGGQGKRLGTGEDTHEEPTGAQRSW